MRWIRFILSQLGQVSHPMLFFGRRPLLHLEIRTALMIESTSAATPSTRAVMAIINADTATPPGEGEAGGVEGAFILHQLIGYSTVVLYLCKAVETYRNNILMSLPELWS